MREHLNTWLSHLSAVENVSNHTIRAYGSDLRKFLDTLETQAGRELQPDFITLRHIRRYMGALSTTNEHGQRIPVSRKTKARTLSSSW